MMELITEKIKLNDSNFKELQAFEVHGERFFHQMRYLEYLQVYLNQAIYLLIVKNENKIIAFTTFSESNGDELNSGGLALSLYLEPSIVETKMAKQASSIIFNELLDISRELDKTDILFSDEPIIRDLCFGKEFKVKSYLNGELDLDKLSVDSLVWLRKSYRSLVNWGKKSLKLIVVDRNNLDEKLFEDFRQFHIAVTARETRSHASWLEQLKGIKNSEDFLNLAYLDNKLVSANLVLTSKDQAFYGVGVNNRSLMAENTPVGHYPIYHAIIHAKKLGKSVFDFGNLGPDFHSDKERSIALFKKGFCSELKFKNSIVLKIN